MVTAADTVMRHVVIILTLTLIFIQVKTDLNHESNKCSIISETVLAIFITFAVKIVRLNVCIISSNSDDLAPSLKVTIESQT